MNMSQGRLARVAGSLVLATSALTFTALPATAAKATGTASAAPRVTAHTAAPQVATGPASDVVVRAGAVSATGIQPAATPPSGYAPTDLLSAYNLAAAATTGGTGATVAVIAAFDDPNAEADLTVYRAQYGLPACTSANGCFTKVNQNGAASPLPAANSTYAQAESIDLDMVSAICPNCHILLVEANTPSMTDEGPGVNSAVALGARYVVFDTDGGGTDQLYGQYLDHPGVAITAPAGDSGYSTGGGVYPASSQYVTAVGGTTLTRASSARGWSETVWSQQAAGTPATTSGCVPSFYGKPSWQTDPCPGRTDNDVAAVADPNTGVAFYDTDGQAGWNVGGGTAVSAAIIGGVYALAGTPQQGTYPVTYPYLHNSSLYQVTAGSNAAAGCPLVYLCTGEPGYNGPAGWGTPDGPAGFAFGTVSGDYVAAISPGGQVANKLPATVSVPVTAIDSAAGEALSYKATGLPPGVTIDPATGVITGTVTAAYSGTATVTVTDPTEAKASVSFGWSDRNTIAVIVPGNPYPVQTKPGTAVSLQVTASDAEAGQTFTFSATGLPPGLLIDQSTGLISGTPSTVGTYTVRVTATDPTGSAGLSTFTWRIWNVITVTAPASETSSAGIPITPVQVTATDSENGTKLTYSASGLPPGLSIDPASGLITGTPTAVWGPSNTALTVTDGTVSIGSSLILWSVHGVITITSPGNQTTTAGRNADIPLTVTDSAADDTLTYSIAGEPYGTGLDGNTAVVTGVPVVPGTYHVRFTATGLAGGSASVTFTWTVQPAVTYSGTIRLSKMGYCLDDWHNSSSNGAVVQIWRCNGTAAQRWQVLSDGTIRHNGLCLDAKGNGTTNGTKVLLWACGTGKANQKWDTKGYRIHYDNPAATGKVLDDPGFRGAGTQQEIWTSNGGINQIWVTT